MKKLPDDLAQKLLDVSDDFQGTGLDVSVDDIARMTDVPRATLYYYFSGKDDLVAFYMNDKFTRIGDAVVKAATGSGTVVERLDSALTAVLHALAAHPVVCVELPAAIKQSGDFQEVMAAADRTVLTPLRELLIEGRATGELHIADPQMTAVALMGALNMVGMMQVVDTGGIEADRIAPALVPQLIHGLLP